MRLKLGTVQFHHRANDKAYNLAVIERFALEAAAGGVKILAFPEMCVTGYWHVRNLGQQELGTLAEPVPDGASTMKTMALARELDMAIGVGLIECTNDGRLFNSYVLCQHRRDVRLPPQATRLRERAYPERRSLHSDRLALGCQDRHPHLLRLQPDRERSCDCAAWRGYSPRTASDGRMRLA